MQWLAKATDLKLAIEGLGAEKSCCRTFSSLKIEKREEGVVQNTFFSVDSRGSSSSFQQAYPLVLGCDALCPVLSSGLYHSM